MKRLAIAFGVLLGLWLVAPPLSAQLNRIAARQIACLANTVINGSATGLATCASTPSVLGLSAPNGTAAETGVLRWNSNAFEMGGLTGSGTARNTRILTGSTAGVIIQAGGSDKFLFDSSGNLTNSSTGVISTGAAPGTALANSLFLKTIAFSALGTPSDGTEIYCSDCTVTTAASCPGTQASCVCAGSGSGAFARRVASAWYCTF